MTAVLHCKDETSKMRDIFKGRRDLMVELLSEIEGMKVNRPQGAFYLFPDVSSFYGKSHEGKTIQGASDICEFLLEDCLVAATPGDAFGCPDNIRFSYANSEEQLREAARRIKSSLEKLA